MKTKQKTQARRDQRQLLIRFTSEEWAVIERELRRQPYPVPVGPLCKTLILRALGRAATEETVLANSA